MSETTSRSAGGYLLAISIGPVQEFIAASRKARDLWYGSELLSELSRTAAQHLHRPGSVDLIFPPPGSVEGSEDDRPAVANKLLVHVRDGDPAELARTAKAKVTQRLFDDWNEIWAKHPLGDRLLEGVIDEPLLQRQVPGFVEWYAAWVPYADGDDYTSRRKRVELLLAGRKALRDFAPAHGRHDPDMDGRPKSSLDPSRETVIRHDRIARLTDDQQERIRRRLRLKGNEQLDGISLLKRLGGENRLVSVSRVAVDPFTRRAIADGHHDEVTALRKAAEKLQGTDLSEKFDASRDALAKFADFPFDCQLFYARSTTDVKMEGFTEDEKTAVEDFCETVTELRRSLSSSPTAYFAVLVADGDHMGRALGTLEDPKDHRAFSRRLTEFATKARETVKAHSGAMVYSGGDDVLAFLPLDTALPCAHALKNAFTDIMNDALNEHPGVQRPTLSVGIAIGHYAEHLQVLLDRGRDAERAAKGPRNALAVSFAAHSGGGDSRTVTHRWDLDPVRSRWWLAINAFRLDAISDGTVYELGDLHRELAPLADNALLAQHNLVASEVARIIERKRVEGGRRRARRWIVDEITDRLKGDTPKRQLAELRKLIDELYIARKILPAIMLGGDADGFPLWTDTTAGPGVSLDPPANAEDEQTPDPQEHVA